MSPFLRQVKPLRKHDELSKSRIALPKTHEKLASDLSHIIDSATPRTSEVLVTNNLYRFAKCSAQSTIIEAVRDALSASKQVKRTLLETFRSRDVNKSVVAEEINVSCTSLFKKQNTATTMTRGLSFTDKAVITKCYRQLDVSTTYPNKQKSAKKDSPIPILTQPGKAKFEKFKT